MTFGFQSTHPLRGATSERRRKVDRLKAFQSTHPLRGATKYNKEEKRLLKISIHAPLAGCDNLVNAQKRGDKNFNPRTPCGVRPTVHDSIIGECNFNPRTPCGVRRIKQFFAFPPIFRFQSTHPLRGATCADYDIKKHRCISIHAPLAGCDIVDQYDFPQLENFNPRTPCGVRRENPDDFCSYGVFQSTHPLRGATSPIACEEAKKIISIHAPLAGCDSWRLNGRHEIEISIHAPLAGCDAQCYSCPMVLRHFNPRTPCGVRLSGAV